MRNAASLPDGARQLTRVVAEMGGKNCVIVDADADLDDAVPAIAQSAFAYAGQKCSAASRVLVHEAIADALLERLGGAAGVLEVGPADAWGTDVPPVIEREAQERVERYARIAAPRATSWPRRRAPAARAGTSLRGSSPICPPTRRCCATRSSARC